MKLIYVSSPYTGDLERDLEYARRACRTVMECGECPIAPRLIYSAILDDMAPAERKPSAEMSQALLHRCNEVWAFGPVTGSGMKREIAEAKRLYMPVRKKVLAENLAQDSSLPPTDMKRGEETQWSMEMS